MFSQVTTLPPSGFYYLGHLQHTVRALCLISVALMTHPVSQMPLWHKDSLRHPIFHDCMTHINDWSLLWCSHAFCTAIIHIWLLRKKEQVYWFLHSCFTLFAAFFQWCSKRRHVIALWLGHPVLGEAFPLTVPSGQWKTFVYLFLDAYWALCLQRMHLNHCFW